MTDRAARAAGASHSGLTALLPLFLVSASAVGFEIALTRYFAVAKWSEYGYWVISIVMAGFALSGVALALWRDAFVRRAPWLLSALPAVLVTTGAAGFYFTATNPFNPLQLQNEATWAPQLGNIAGYYACLLPFFFAAGLYIGLSFIMNADRIGTVYGVDLTGAGVGALLTLLLMLWLHPFMLPATLLLPLAAASWFGIGRRRRASIAAALTALLVAEFVLWYDNPAAINDFKAIYAPLHTPGAGVVAERRSPRGLYQLLEDFTERVDTDVSNDAGMLGLPGPPSTFGLYRDGTRIAGLPRPGAVDVGYAPAALDALPYMLLHQPRVLLAGASGGFRISEALALEAGSVLALEPEPVLFGALRAGLGPSPARAPDNRVTISGAAPMAAARQGGSYDLVDVSADFLDASEANATALTTEATAAYLRALRPDGIVSLPASIRDFPVYALRLLATARAAALQAGLGDPAAHVVIYRSAWSVRVLLSREPWTAARLAVVQRFSDERSFDISYYPGIDPAEARGRIYNDLPAVSFTTGEVAASGGPDDAIADEARAVLDGKPTPSAKDFNLAATTLDQPLFYAALRLGRLGTVLRRLEILPQAEIGALVNIAVLGQAAAIAVIVLLLPLLAPRRIGRREGGMLRAILYFPALGLGFLFIEIFLIEKASLYLNDRTSAFALVLTGMLVLSGLGSMTTGRLVADPRRAVGVACLVILLWCGGLAFGLPPLFAATFAWPWVFRLLLLVLVLAPGAVALGMPFPLGLARAGSGGMLPWAWALNGAFSVMATPLANLIAREAGFSRVLFAGFLVYGVAWIAFPVSRQDPNWPNRREVSHAAE